MLSFDRSRARKQQVIVPSARPKKPDLAMVPGDGRT